MEYEIVYSKRKTIGITVLPSRTVMVRAPFGVSHKIIDEIVNKHTRWIEKRILAITETPPNELPSSQDEILELKKKTKELVTPFLEKYAKQMGVTYTKVSVTSAKKVFGSCTTKKHLNFSFRLALYPMEAIEYVVVHELCHLKEMNHSKKFWYEVEKALPDYKERRKLLRR